MCGIPKLNIRMLISIQFCMFGKGHFTQYNSALQRHQDAVRHNFKALEVPQRQSADTTNSISTMVVVI